MLNSPFNELVGQELVIEVLKSAVAASRTNDESQEMTHAWLFTGPAGSGLSSVANAFAQSLICPNGGCGECNSCSLTKLSFHPDVENMHAQGLSIKVEEIRELLTKVAWAPSISGWRVVVLEDADRLTESAATALLRAIEEPGTRTVWLICAPSLNDVLSTIRSRCRHVQLNSPSLKEVTNFLIDRFHIAPSLANFAAQISRGDISRAKLLATSEQARNNRLLLMRLPLQLGTLAAAFQAAQTLVDLATTQAITSSIEHDLHEIEKLQHTFGNGGTGRALASGGAKAVKELEKEQKLRSTRRVRKSIDRALVDIATFYRDVMVIQAGESDSVVNTDICDEIKSYAANSRAHLTVYKFNSIMIARSNLESNGTSLVTCEALMCRLAKL
jgi:DNA polymerase III subunit delta'